MLMRKCLGMSIIISAILFFMVLLLSICDYSTYTIFLHHIKGMPVVIHDITFISVLLYLGSSMLFFGGVLALVDYEGVIPRHNRIIYILLSTFGIFNIFITHFSTMFTYFSFRNMIDIIYFLLYIFTSLFVLIAIALSWYLFRTSTLLKYKLYSLWSLAMLTSIVSSKLVAIIFIVNLDSSAFLFEQIAIGSFILWLYVKGLLIYNDKDIIL